MSDAPAPTRAEEAREAGQVAYEARFAGARPREVTPWADQPDDVKAIWARVEQASAAPAEADAARLMAALRLLLPFVDHSAGHGLLFFLGSGEPDMDAADLCMAASAALGIECGGAEYDAILAAGKAALAALHEGDHAGGGADAP